MGPSGTIHSRSTSVSSADLDNTPPNETRPLLRPNQNLTVKSDSYYYAVNDSSITRFAAQTAVGAPVVGAADPSHKHHGEGGKRPENEKVKGKRLAILLFGLWISNFTFALQTSAIPTLAPRISASFSHSELASYIGSIFPLFQTAFTPVYGLLLDTLPRSTCMHLATILYAAGTVLCGFAPSMGYLIGARAIAGAGGAGLLTISSVITTDLTSLRERGYYQGLMMIVFGVGAAIGGPIAGGIADVYGWQYTFFAQVPPLLVCSFILVVYLPPTPQVHGSGSDDSSQRTLRQAFATFDFLGTTLLFIATACLMLGVSYHTAFLYPWSSPYVGGLLAGSVVAFLLFGIVEGTYAERPVIPLFLFRNGKLLSIFVSNAMLSVAAQTLLYHIPVFFTVVLNSSSAVAGAHLLPNSIGLAIGSLVAGQFIKKTGKYAILSAIGLALPIFSIYLASTWHEGTPEWIYWLSVFPAGLGYSSFLCCSLVALIAEVQPEWMPKATSVLYTVRSFGTTLGIASSSSFQQGTLVYELRKLFQDKEVSDRERIIDAILHSKSAILNLPPAQQVIAEEAYRFSLSQTFLFGTGAAIITLLTSLYIGEKDLGPTKKHAKRLRQAAQREQEDREEGEA